VNISSGPEKAVNRIHLLDQGGQIFFGNILLKPFPEFRGQGEFPIAIGPGPSPAAEDAAEVALDTGNRRLNGWVISG